jgi:HAD superfamily hydrolase (TIGR01509 family)
LTNIADFRPRAVVFDLDGTLTDNMPMHAEAFSVFAERHGLPPLTMADRHALDGKRNSEIFPVLFKRVLADAEWRAYEDEKESLYRECSAGRLAPLAGAIRLLERLSVRRIVVAVATSAPAPNVTHTLGEIGLTHLLASVVRGDQVPNGKPAPDVFLEAARRLGVDPSECLAFEDAPMGVEAAVAAGMRCVAVTTSFDEAAFAAARVPPHAMVRDYDEFLATASWLAG